MKKIFLILLLFVSQITIKAQYNLVVLDFNTITLIDTLTEESYGYVKHDTELEFDHNKNTFEIYNHATDNTSYFDIIDVSIIDDTALFFCSDLEGNLTKVFVGYGKVAILSKVIPYTMIYSNE